MECRGMVLRVIVLYVLIFICVCVFHKVEKKGPRNHDVRQANNS